MRRPTFCSSFDEDDHAITAPSDKESRLSKMKRILTATIYLGRRGKKEPVHPLSTKAHDFDETERQFYEKEKLEKSLVEMGHGEMNKCKITKGIRTKSSKQRFDENMETETNVTLKGDLSICMPKNTANGMRGAKEAKDMATAVIEGKDTENGKLSAAGEIVLIPRKRKERLDSENSIMQEYKVIRSNSEERPEDEENKCKESNIRRVSSHEDFTRARVLQEINVGDISVFPRESEGDAGETYKRNAFCMDEMFHNAEELEHEKIRSCERFSRAGATLRGRRIYPRKRIKGSKKRMAGEEMSEVRQRESLLMQETMLRGVERDSSPTPKESSSPPALDISSLHKQMEGSEPITSRGKVLTPEDEPEGPSIEVLVSPRNSLVMRLLNSDPSMPPSPPKEHNIRHGNYERHERKLSKQINSIKRQLKRYEEGFQKEFGYRPSHADKMANKDIKKMCLDLSKLKSQLNQYTEGFTNELPSPPKQLSFLTSLENNCTANGTSSSTKQPKCNKTMQEILAEAEKRLQEKRQQNGRSSEISEMNRGDLLEEKLAVQKALLHLENHFGRPITKEDKDLVRPLYQRYRFLKRLVVRGAAAKLNNSTGELATILEHEAMEFTNSPSTSFDLGDGTLSAPEGLNESFAVEQSSSSKAPGEQAPEEVPSGSSSSDSIWENLHALPLCQLLEQQKNAKEEKKKLRRRLKEFDESFQTVSGRRAHKQDRVMVEGIYINYKQVKAKLRLLDALVAKKSCVKRNSC